MKDIILASTSIYRRQQLQQLNLTFSAMSPEVDESPLKEALSDHVELSQQLALLKAEVISDQHPAAVVIGGDQVASFGGNALDGDGNRQNILLSKPKTKARAFEQLRMLSGHQHRLITSVAIIADQKAHVHTCVARMTMRVLTDEQIERYIDADEPLACCGSYRLEALGVSLFERIECEDHTAIIGIPLMWTAKTLSTLGVPVP